MTSDTILSDDAIASVSFRDLGLPEAMLTALSDIGYETPSPIQAQTIPLLLEGRDVLGQAQTGTGKTAAFALPILARLDLSKRHTQVLVLAPTRELAIQVAEAFQKYASHLGNFHVLPIYGGTEYRQQLRHLQQGAQVVVGTPGRVMDHMRRGTLDLSNLQCLVLDEADEMLRMGFIDDVEWILEQTPPERQIALFSATMPREVRRIAQTHLNNPAEITIAQKTTTAATIRQRYWTVSGMQKLDALTRILEVETFDAVIIFVRTKTATIELADKLRARGYSTAALNGDIAQSQREHTVNQIKSGGIDIIIATDVAARGLDVERITHVVNYDIPHDTESYVHRIGRTGRAGRSGEAILFVAPRENRLLFAIERATRQPIERMELPSAKLINDKRIERFKQRITDTLANDELDLYLELVNQYQQEHDVPAERIAAALARLTQGDAAFLLQDRPAAERPARDHHRERPERGERNERFERGDRNDRNDRSKPPRLDKLREIEPGMARFRIDVGLYNSVKPGNIVGAIANEAGLDSKNIGHIALFDTWSTVDLPADISEGVLNLLKKTRVAGRAMNIVPFNGEAPAFEERGGFRKEPREHKPRNDYREGKPAHRKGAAGRDGQRHKPAQQDAYTDQPSFDHDTFDHDDREPNFNNEATYQRQTAQKYEMSYNRPPGFKKPAAGAKAGGQRQDGGFRKAAPGAKPAAGGFRKAGPGTAAGKPGGFRKPGGAKPAGGFRQDPYRMDSFRGDNDFYQTPVAPKKEPVVVKKAIKLADGIEAAPREKISLSRKPAVAAAEVVAEKPKRGRPKKVVEE